MAAINPKNVKYYDSTALEASAIIKSTAGTLYSVTGYNDNAVAQFIQLHDASSLPADGGVPKIVLVVGAKENFYYDLGEIGRWFSTGVIVCNSTTAATKTIGAANCWFDAQYD